MDLSEPQRRPRAESIVPMINVVFLLLIFFLMTSRLVQPDPFEVTPPEAALETEAASEITLYVDATGKLAFDGAEGEAALAYLSAQASDSATVQLRADAALEASAAAKLLNKLAAAGFARVELVVTPK